MANVRQDTRRAGVTEVAVSVRQAQVGTRAAITGMSGERPDSLGSPLEKAPGVTPGSLEVRTLV
jgi:hypothetical protein